MTEWSLSVPQDVTPVRIDKYLSIAMTDAAEQVYSRSAISALLEDGKVLLNGKNGREKR